MLLPVYNPEIPIAGLRRHNAILRTDAYVGNRDMRTKQLIGSIGYEKSYPFTTETGW
jgi:hypothetical protein